MEMSRQVRDVFILAALLAGYGLLLWAYERAAATQWGETLAENPRAIFARDHDRERRIAEELEAEPFTFTPPADDMAAAPLEGSDDGTG